MRRGAPILLILAGLALGGAQAAPEVAERWTDDMVEVASALELTADGRFVWLLSYGALDMGGQGRWTRAADGSLRLTSDPPVEAPRFELISRGRDDRQSGILVRVADESNATPIYLGAVAEYEDGEETGAHFEGGEALLEAGPGRRIVAVRVASPPFGLRSDRYAVAAGDVLSFRFLANDLGLWDFRDVRATIEGDRLSLDWRGEPLLYLRAGAEPAPTPAARVEAAPAEDDGRPLPLPPPDSFPIEPPSTPARRDGPPSGPFRPGEAVETSLHWEEHRGTVDGLPYSYKVDPQGLAAGGTLDGPDGEGGIDEDDPDEWHIGVDRDIDGNAGRWSVGHNASGLGLRIDADGRVAQYCLDSGHPDRAHRLVVGTNPPLRLGVDCVAADGSPIEAALLAGGTFGVEAYHWADETVDRRSGKADLFPRVLELVRFLQAYRR